jgi:site-specific recombinase XerD
VARNQSQYGERGGGGYERIGERVSIFVNGRVWYANWQEGPKQQRKSLRTRNHEVARQKARALEAELTGAVPRQAGTVDIAVAAQAYVDWQDSNDRAPKTMIKYRDVLNRFAAHCRDAGVRLMHAVTTQTVDEFGVCRRRDGMAAKTVYTELTIVRQWLNFAVSRRMLAASPVSGTKLVKPKPGPRDYWRQEQLDAIVEAARAPYKAAYLLMAETGMRVGEVVHLTHDDLTLDGPTPVAHIDEEALKIYVHIADEQAQLTMRQLAERRQAAGRATKPTRGRQGISNVSAKSRRSNMTRCSKSLGNKACSLRHSPTSGEGGIRTRGPAFDRTRL